MLPARSAPLVRDDGSIDIDAFSNSHLHRRISIRCCCTVRTSRERNDLADRAVLEGSIGLVSGTAAVRQHREELGVGGTAS